MRKISSFFGSWLLIGWFSSFPVTGLHSANAGLPMEPLAEDYPLQIQALVNDPLFVQQDNLQQLQIESAWEVTTGSSVTIALIDTGISASHEDLSGKLWTNSREVPNNGVDDDNNGYIDDISGYNFLQNNNNLSDNNGHGTSVASIVAATTNNNKGIAGINWNAKIMVLKALNSLGGGEYSHVVSAIRYAVDNGARVINMSFGTYINNSDLESAVNYAISRGVTVVAAAGNNNQEKLLYPASYVDVIAVGAVDSAGARASFSNYGGNLDIMAPGVNVTAAYFERSDAYAKYSGTSYASAQVTGVVSLMLSKRLDLTPAQIESFLKVTATPGGNVLECGGGLVNARKALDGIVQAGTITATITISSNNLLADGRDGSWVTVIIKEGDLVAGSRRVQLKIKNGPVIINNVVTTVALIDLGATDNQGILSVNVSSYLPGEKQLIFIDAASGMELGSATIQFNNLNANRYQTSLVAKSFDLNLNVGEEDTLWVDLKNTGSAPWIGAGNNRNQFRLGTAGPRDRLSLLADANWISGNRTATLEQVVVYPGEVGRISFSIKASQPGTYKEYFSPVVEYISWLNLPISWKITIKSVAISAYQTDLISRSGDLELQRGELAMLTVVFKNTGSSGWSTANVGAVRLGASQPNDRQSRFYNNSWLSNNRTIGTFFEIKPGSEMTLTFAIVAPDTAGVYYESFKLVSEYITWFGPTVTWRIKVI